MADYREQIHELLWEAESLPHSDPQVALTEEAVRLADHHQDIELGFEAREALVQAAVFGGVAEKAIVAFAWILGQCDRDPERFNEEFVLWRYKWICGCLSKYPDIARAQIESRMDDLAQRCHRNGYGLRSVHKLRHEYHRSTGQLERAREERKSWFDAPRDGNTDCYACELNSEARSLIDDGELEAALDHLEPILDKRAACGEIPHITYSMILLPLLRLGREEDALRYHRIGYPMVRKNRTYLADVGDHLRLAALTDQVGRACSLFENHLSWALDTRNAHEEAWFLRPCLLLFRVLRESGKKTRSFQFPREAPFFREDGEYSVAEIESWLLARSHEIATAFDRRNGNDHVSKQIDEELALLDEFEPQT